MTGTILEKAIRLQLEADKLLIKGKQMNLPKGVYKQIKKEKKEMDKLVNELKKMVAGK